MLKKLLFNSIFITSTLLTAQTLSNGEVSSRDLLTNDTKKAEKFYTELFSWTSKPKGNYIQMYKDKDLIANIVYIDTKKHAQWMPQFTHDNLKSAKATILQSGGKILKEVHNNEEGKSYLLLRDAQGALAVLTNDNKALNTEFPQVGEWLWDELWSFDVPASENFYTHLFDYEKDKTDAGYIVFKKNDKWIAGLLMNPFKESQTQWVSTIRVNDPKAVSIKAVSLGGKILVSVEENKGHREAALIADPTGAVFIVEKFTQEKH